MAGVAILNGWQRLGVVISALIAIPSGYWGYLDNDSAYVTAWPMPDVLAMKGQAFTDKAYWDAAKSNPRLKDCILETARVSRDGYGNSVTITCDRGTLAVMNDTFWYVFLPFATVFGFGYIFAWVYRGFRPKPA